MNIFVGNLLFESTEADVRKLFEGFGIVASVAIVMDKKGKKSRGFGFVDMPNDEEANAAIAALNEKGFMGRALNVAPSVPKTEEGRDERLRKKKQLEIDAKPAENILQEKIQKPAFKPDFKTRGSNYKTGRRSINYLKKHSAEGTTEGFRTRRRSQDNPMRWKKRPKFWQKPEGEAKPSENREGVARKPWVKREGEAKPWEKREGERKPWVKREGERKPWVKREGERKPWAKSEGRSKSWEKPKEESKSWQRHKEKLAGGSESKRPARPGYKGTGSSGGYTKRKKRF